MKATLLSGLAVIALAGCARDLRLEETPPEGFGYISADGVQRLEVWGRTIEFDPDRLVVVSGRPVELLVRRYPGSIRHNFVIDAPEAGISVDIPLKYETQVVRFTPKQPGLYMYTSGRRYYWRDVTNDTVYGNLIVLPEEPETEISGQSLR